MTVWNARACAATAALAVLAGCASPSDGAAQQATLPSPFPVAQEGPCCGPVTPAGQHLAQILDASDVEHLWQNERHVDWQTGEPDMPADWKGRDAETHCSAFAAAMSVRLSVYLLRPPEHRLGLLANAQGEWLDSAAGRRAGWQPVSSLEQVQALANQGWFVVGVYINPDRHRPGHIVVVRPSSKTDAYLQVHGPQVAEASYHNHVSWSARGSFAADHYADVKYYAHAVPQNQANP
ncbi:hypothetical protein [Paraburkholderia sp. DHOC27]|uniref:hypothetical protein n=1 Tax=Paraburkholderia sp. DHOC27 TaxID=2303330 RepID=UPI000E3D7B6E|nr:hypothetical protein [Paraburkholderia sp. DHOC27]RFU45413.1 hypothetical protein D0B32_22625 [Paraburkholderia sp. DHOC27]